MSGDVIVTHIKSILTHHFTNRKGNYIPEKYVDGSICCRIDAPKLDDALVGSNVYVVTKSNVEEYKYKVLSAFTDFDTKLKPDGVYVCASSLGSLEAMYEYLTENDINIGGFRIGSITKKDISMAKSYMIVFDIVVSKELKDYAATKNVLIFEHNIIYKLFVIIII